MEVVGRGVDELGVGGEVIGESGAASGLPDVGAVFIDDVIADRATAAGDLYPCPCIIIYRVIPHMIIRQSGKPNSRFAVDQ